MKILFVSAMLLLANSCGVSREPKNNSREPLPAPGTAQLIDGANRFGLDLFREISKGSAHNDNVFISPLSIHTAIAMAWNGAGTSTKQQLAERLYLPSGNDQQINEAMKQMMASLMNSDPKVKMDVANSVWYRSGYKVKSSFLDVNRNYLNADVAELDFSDPKAKDQINGWVARKTNDRIKQIVDEITPEHVMFLINAVHFKGIWEKEFKKDLTQNRPFYLADGSIKQLMTMEMKSRFSYSELEGYRVLELPYGNGNFSMLVLLPDKEMDINKLVQKLTADEWNTIASDLNYKTEISIRLPRFTFSYETELKKPLMQLGITEAFIPELANFKGITDSDIYISRVRHKSFVEVNEEGTEAAAVTSIEFRETAMPSEPLTFYVDRPFVFALREKTTNSLMFIGKVMEPVQ